MTRDEAVTTIRDFAADLAAGYGQINKPDRVVHARQLENALAVLAAPPLENGATVPFDWDDVNWLRAQARMIRGMPGMHMKTLRPQDMANRLAEFLEQHGL